MPQTIDLKAVQNIRKQTTGRIQSAKIRASKDAIGRAQAAGDMPEDKKDITSYVTSTNPANRYVDIDKFYRVMAAKPDKYWQKKFIHTASDLGDYQKIADATNYALQEITARTPVAAKSSAPGHPGLLRRSIKTLVDGRESNSPGQDIIRDSAAAPIVEITNYAEYASTAEARSFFSAQAGIIYYVAQRTQTKYPELGIFFYYSKADAFGLPHVYDVPVLRISTPENATGKWGKPGVNARKRLKHVRRINRVFK